MAKWIWKFGEFEIYHSLMLHDRRQQYGYPEPVVWKMYAPEPVVVFQKKVTTAGGVFRIHACGHVSTTIQTGSKLWETEKYGGKTEIALKAGTVTVQIRVSNLKTFPCLFVEGVIESDESWEADDLSMNFEPVGTDSLFMDREKTPEIFPFSYAPISYRKKEKLENGVLFDYGKETFAAVRLLHLTDQKVQVNFGESQEEALDHDWSVIHFLQEPKEGELSYAPCAFRYLYVSDEGAEAEAEYEYLPLEYRGNFQCEDELINRVWHVAAYTFRLNCREFFLDGIKRDRWVWSADAYQSLFVNRYLFFDPEIEKRTLIALGGKAPFKRHINTIMDYTFFWFIGIKEYYQTYGDRKFVRQILPQMKEVMAFCEGRESDDGFMREKQGDWNFIDWAPMDKEGALCGEQILYGKALECYGDLLKAAFSKDIENESRPVDTKQEQGLELAEGYGRKARRLYELIKEKFYDKEKEVFIDSFESGRRNVTRHSNILAYLFLPCSEKQKKDIYEKVILNEAVRQITTPYFKFYENQVHCLEGNGRLLEESIRKYYGSMLKTGATTLYEEYDPAMKGAEHYAMYGNPYEKSLCHAWSASPIYLLGAFRLGVLSTDVAYETFDVRPDLGDLKWFCGKVPVPGGVVEVCANEKEIRVWTDVSGGTLWVEGKAWELVAGKETVVKIRHLSF
ncbi:alpha-L-rhamnosidase-related protein [Parablautia muri]|nr:amylo-alpha-1,6-glucosidase [Parablautia muri]